IYRLPTLPGWHRRLVWLSAWMIPAGYILASLFPLQVKAGLHVVFIGGFALMALSVGLHVTLAHGGYTRLVSARPWQVPGDGGVLVAAVGRRGRVRCARVHSLGIRGRAAPHQRAPPRRSAVALRRESRL